MNGIPDFLLIVIGLDILVVAVLGYWIVKKKIRKPKGTAVVLKPLLKPSVKDMVVHRCPKCDGLFEYPAKEIVHVTNPASERLVCPFCYAPLQ